MIKEATFGAGCFWCVEPCFDSLKGVISARPGYAGGFIENPTYEQVCTGTTKHVEVVRVTYNEHEISYKELLEVFFNVHNPTHLNRQGNDKGEQYRSVIFYHTQEQQQVAEETLEELKNNNPWEDPIVTTIEPISNYYDAENYHRDYAALHPENQYCQMVARPKIEKFKKIFERKLK
jgi:peptide-methionine (S)-S-oxide reductase